MFGNGQPEEDAELVERARSGEVDAYGVLVDRYQHLALRVAYLVVGEVADAEDAAQEAFAKAYFALDRIPPGAAFRPWLLRIVANEARNLRTAARRRAGRITRASTDMPAGSMAPLPEAAALASEQREAVIEAIMRLREEDRLVISYRYLSDLSEAETAQALGWARGTVKSRLSRALGRLRQHLGGVAPALVVAPDLGSLVGQTLAEPGALVPARAAQPFTEAVLQRVSAGGSPPGRRLSQRLRSLHGPLGLVAAALVLLAAGASALLMRPGSPPATPPAQKMVVYGGELTPAERQELADLFEVDGAVAVDTVGREELVAAWHAAGLPIDESYQAISSVALTCLGGGEGLKVRTRNITRIPAAAYASILLTAGVDDVSVIIAAPSTRPITGETAVVGVLKGFRECQGAQQPESERVALAYEQLKVMAALADEKGDWNTVSAVMLKAVEAVTTGQAKDDAAIGAALDAAAGEAVALNPPLRSELVGTLRKLADLEGGAYTHGYEIRQIAPDEVLLAPVGGGKRRGAGSIESAGRTTSE